MSKQYRRLGLLWSTVSLTLSLAVACGGGDDDDDDVAYCETCAPTAPNPPPNVAVEAPTGNPAAGGFVGSGAGDSVGGNDNSFNGGAFGIGGTFAVGGTSVGSGGTSSFASGGSLFTTGGSAFTSGGSPFPGTSSSGGSAAFGGP
jgi:hypothetical protein